jgi:hypothetical protein
MVKWLRLQRGKSSSRHGTEDKARAWSWWIALSISEISALGLGQQIGRNTLHIGFASRKTTQLCQPAAHLKFVRAHLGVRHRPYLIQSGCEAGHPCALLKTELLHDELQLISPPSTVSKLSTFLRSRCAEGKKNQRARGNIQ